MVTKARQEPAAAAIGDLLDELRRIDRLVRLHVAGARQAPAANDSLGGLHVSQAEVDALLAEPVGLPPWAAAAHSDPRTQELLAESASSEGRVAELARRFDLEPFDRDVLLVCLAPEIDRRYERLFAYLQDDVTRKRPSVDLVLDLLCATFEAKLAARARFDGGPLIRHCLLELLDEPSQPRSPLLAKSLKVDRRIAGYLLGSDRSDPRLEPWTLLVEPVAELAELVQPLDFQRRLEILTEPGGLARGAALLILEGRRGSGRKTTAEALCRRLGRRLLTIDLELLAATDEPTFDEVLRRAGREARLQDAVVAGLGLDAFLGREHDRRRRRLLRAFDALADFAVLIGEGGGEVLDASARSPRLRLCLPRPTAADRRRLWRRSLNGNDVGADVETLAAGFRLTPGEIGEAVAAARLAARWRDPEDPRPTAADFAAACRDQSRPTLGQLARKIEPRYRWDDIVLPEDRMALMREIADQMRHRGRVYEDWGYGRKLSLGKGLNVLFCGRPGTGKTMAAEVLAGELGLDLYRIDLAAVVSKYIGETEKNLSRIFAEAEAADAILFFDEADALFGKRTEIRDSHDRYANLEVSYLLQRMEEYDGAVVLATNFRGNLDEAFERRFHFAVDFPMPATAGRLRIWRQIWPSETPCSPDLDFPLLAERLELAGGNIRNIALAAAFLAAADGGVVDMDHVAHATRREFQKLGKILADGALEAADG